MIGDFLGYRIEYSRFLKRWFVSDYDWGLGWVDIGPSHPSKNAAMHWVERNIGA